jgi:hypothetical protein
MRLTPTLPCEMGGNSTNSAQSSTSKRTFREKQVKQIFIPPRNPERPTGTGNCCKSVLYPLFLLHFGELPSESPDFRRSFFVQKSPEGG